MLYLVWSAHKYRSPIIAAHNYDLKWVGKIVVELKITTHLLHIYFAYILVFVNDLKKKYLYYLFLQMADAWPKLLFSIFKYTIVRVVYNWNTYNSYDCLWNLKRYFSFKIVYYGRRWKHLEKNKKRSQQSNNAIIIVMKPYLYTYTVKSLLFSYCDEFAQLILYTIKYNTRIITKYSFFWVLRIIIIQSIFNTM